MQFKLAQVCSFSYDVNRDYSSSDIPSLVGKLNNTQCTEEVHKHAADALAYIAFEDAGNQAEIVAAGAIIPIVDLLGSKSSGVQESAAGALWYLIKDCTANRVKFAAAGAIPALVSLLGPQRSNGVISSALLALYYLAENSSDNLVAEIVAAGAIPPLVALLGPQSSTKVQMNAAGALMKLASLANNKLIRSAGGVLALRLLIQSTTDDRVRETATMAYGMVNIVA